MNYSVVALRLLSIYIDRNYSVVISVLFTNNNKGLYLWRQVGLMVSALKSGSCCFNLLLGTLNVIIVMCLAELLFVNFVM